MNSINISMARRYRPQVFRDVVGQEFVVTTLKNALCKNLLSNAYIFYGMRGSGKTTIARILAKAINCENRQENCEPCNECEFCREVIDGNSLNFIEIDAASNRGIDEIRQINESTIYESTCGKFKIYLIDEVHMLTIQAFNAILKTLEEPPEGVKFFFATTEIEKVPTTIMSRCQRFNLRGLSFSSIISKLKFIAENNEINVDRRALELIARLSEGSLRDAIFMMEQTFTFVDKDIAVEDVEKIFGIISCEDLFFLDVAMRDGDVGFANVLASKVFYEGKDLLRFVDFLIAHVENVLHVLLGIELSSNLGEYEKGKLSVNGKFYTIEQSHYLIDLLLDNREKAKKVSSVVIFLESLLVRFIKSRDLVSIDVLMEKLNKIEKTFEGSKKIDNVVKYENKKAVNVDINIDKKIAEKQRIKTLLQFAVVEFDGKERKVNL